MVSGNAARRYLVLADIHSNEPALRAVLDDASRHGPYDGKLCAGDVVGYGPNPNECIGMVTGEGFVTVLGNHDSAVRGDPRENLDRAASIAAFLQGNMLNEASRSFLKSLDSSPYVDPEGRFAMVHGSFVGSLKMKGAPFSFEDAYITGEDDVELAMRCFKIPQPSEHQVDGTTGVKLGIFGHTHVPAYALGWTTENPNTGYTRVGTNLTFWNHTISSLETTEAKKYLLEMKDMSRIVRTRSSPSKPTSRPHSEVGEKVIPLEFGRPPSEPGNWKLTALFNPGSVGQPRHGSPAACYGIVEFTSNGAAKIIFRSVEYDVAETQRRMRENSFPDFTVERLEYGL